jgi:transcriptional regulator with XRE-family HTH domain
MNSNELLIDLAQKIKTLRMKKGVTQEQMYNDTGIHVARIEQGKRDISYSTLKKLAEYFEVSLIFFD